MLKHDIELEYEIKLPQFLIDYSEKSNKKDVKSSDKLMTIQTESEDMEEIIEEYDEEDLLMEEERNKEKEIKNKRNNTLTKNDLNGSTPTPTPTPDGETITPYHNQLSDSNDEDSCKNNVEQNAIFNKESEEEKIYNIRMNQYKTLFNEGKVNELEELIDDCNKNSSSVEYKFNFTFDKYKYGNKQISYIIRCIDTKNDFGVSIEESAADLDPKACKYKKEKAESIKPLFELLEEERKEIIELPEYFINLSLENKKFQKLLQLCKNDINIMSKTHGQKKDEVLEDENSSQTSQAGFDNGLVKKNRIEEFRSNLLTNISNFYTFKYIKSIIYLIGALSIIFAIFYIIYFLNLYTKLYNSNIINIYLYETTLWTSELIQIFVSLRVLYSKEIINKNNDPSFEYFDFLTNKRNISEYYDYFLSQSLILYEHLSDASGYLEMEIPGYLTEEELDNIYWDKVNISYMNENYKLYIYQGDDESFPMSISQLLSNSLTYIQSSIFKSINNKTSFFINENNNLLYFKYITYIIIENGYNNILPNLFNKLMKIPTILSNYNSSQIKNIRIILFIYLSLIVVLCIIFLLFFYITNKSIIDGMDKVSKIKNEKIEEMIKRIKSFNANLKRFKERDIKEENNRYNNIELLDDESKINSENKSDLNNDKKKLNKQTSIVNNNGFNTDYKKYIPLNIMKYSLFYIFGIIIYEIGFKIPIFIITNNMIQNCNQLLIVENYILGNLIVASTSLIEIKCFISDCETTELTSIKLNDYNLIRDVIKGLNRFPSVKEFYNEKYLLNACAASYDQESELEKYNQCLSDSTITTANNTENLLKLTNDLIFNLKKEYEMKIITDPSYNKKNLFNEAKYREIENIFFNYLMNVNSNFIVYVIIDLTSFLYNNQFLQIILLVLYALSAILICIITRLITINKLIHYLRVSRYIMKIIPTSTIISTQELEAWIENKY